jgi:microcystin degradation protein MlrC
LVVAFVALALSVAARETGYAVRVHTESGPADLKKRMTTYEVLMKIDTVLVPHSAPLARITARRPLTLLVALGILVLASALAPEYAAAQNRPDARPFRIAVAQFSMETCTFCPRPTGVAEWEFYGPPQQGEAVLRRGSYIQGFVARAAEYPEVELVGIYSPRSPVGGSSGSWVTTEAFDKDTRGIQDDLRAQGSFDAVYLALHGAMAVTGVPKPEAEIVRRVRQVVGDARIAVTLDLHANVDRELSGAADGVFIVKHFPHYDSRYQGERAARLLVRTLRGDYRPAMAARKPGVITPSVVQWTGESPAIDIMERARVWEFTEPDAFVSVAFGFAYADVPDVGAAVMVITNDDPQLAERIAQDMSAYFWRVREQFFAKPIPKTEEGVREAIRAAREGTTPVIVADDADRTGNSTWILEELIRQGGRNFVIATLADDRAIERIKATSGTGRRVSVEVGGYADRYAGRPVPIEGVVDYLGPWAQHETVAVLRFGENNRVILTPTLHQVTTPEIFRDLEIPTEEIAIAVLKSRVHFRRGFDDTGLARHIVIIDAPGGGPAGPAQLREEACRTRALGSGPPRGPPRRPPLCP